MKSVWFGGDNNYMSNTVASWRSVNTGLGGSWATVEAQASTPISEDVVITGVYFYGDTAPGATKNYTITIRDDGVDTSVSAVMSDTNTSATWTGRVSIAKDSLISIQSTPSGTPTAGTFNWWYITYETVPSSFVSIGGSVTATSTTVTNYMMLESTNATPNATATVFEIPWPMGATLTALTASTPAGSPGTGKSYAVSIRNNTTATDLMTATISDLNTLATASGSVSVSAGDCLVIKIVPTGTPTARAVKVGASFTPAVNGESAFGYANATGPSSSAANFDQTIADGGGWSASEPARNASNLPPFVIRKLYWKITTAPGSGKSLALTVRDNLADTVLTSTIADLATTGSNTTNSIVGLNVFTPANHSSFKTTPTGTPAASGGIRIGYVVYMAPAGKEVFINQAINRSGTY